ncbi:aminoglycoside phosphotransferase family protein, partial [bacterium]|nr:aminoglycoside phosphotransferase family protein [bacterium]
DLILPRLYSYDSDNFIVWQEALNGQPLSKLSEPVADLPKIAGELGQRLASFHGVKLDLSAHMTLEHQIKKLQDYGKIIAQEFPTYADRCAKATKRLLEQAQHLDTTLRKPVHASFKLSHIFITPKGIAFIDFDGTNLGDPGHDLGRFIAYVHNMMIEQKIDPRVGRQVISNFCRGYHNSSTTKIPQKHIDWFAASHLIVSHIYKSVKRVMPAELNALLDEVDDLSCG